MKLGNTSSQFYSFTRLYWLLVIPWDSMWIFGWIFPFLQKSCWDFNRDCIESEISLGGVGVLVIFSQATQGIRENICKTFIWWGFNVHNIQRIPTAQQQRTQQPDFQKGTEVLTNISPKEIHTWPINTQKDENPNH